MDKHFYILKRFTLFLFFVTNQLDSKLKAPIDKNHSYFIANIKLSKFPEKTGFDIYYNGQMFQLKDKCSSFKINLKKNKRKLNILFVGPENISFESDQNTIKSLILKKLKNYKFYEIKNIENDSKLSWRVKESNLSSKNGNGINLIPADTIIVPLDPTDLKIVIENISYPKNNKVGNLPCIKIESKIETSKLEEKIAKSCLSSMNLRPFHKKEELMDIKRSKKKSKVSIII